MILKIPEKSLKCFQKECKARNFLTRVDRGIQVVEIDKIVGSVGRCLDFDAGFTLRASHSVDRLEAIKKALKEQRPLPLVELYKLDDEYYVVDGHHRIAAAKEMGQKFIDAHVVEYLPPVSSRKGLLARKKFDFEYETGLQGIKLSHRSSYDKLLKQIKEHKERLEKKEGRKISLREAAVDWFQSIYYPLTERIKKANLNKYMPNATVGDIYVYICDQINLRNRKKDHYNVNFEEALEEFGLLTRATQLIFSGNGIKEKLRRILLPCFYFQKCPYII